MHTASWVVLAYLKGFELLLKHKITVTLQLYSLQIAADTVMSIRVRSYSHNHMGQKLVVQG